MHARVARVDARQAPGTLRVERVVTLAVVRALKGSPAEALQLVLPGGTYGRYRTVVPGVPEVAEGEEAVLFLRPSPTGATQLVGLLAGRPARPDRSVDGAADGRAPPSCRRSPDRSCAGPPIADRSRWRRFEARIARVVLAQLRGRR